MTAFTKPCGREDWHISHQYGIEHGDMGVAWYDCPGRTEHTAACDAWADMNGSDCTCGLRADEPVHWVGDAPTSLHGNGASSFDRTTRDRAEVTCRLCLTLLAREEPQVCRECRETKHGACDGSSLVDEGHDVLTVDCLCAAANHERSGS